MLFQIATLARLVSSTLLDYPKKKLVAVFNNTKTRSNTESSLGSLKNPRQVRQKFPKTSKFISAVAQKVKLILSKPLQSNDYLIDYRYFSVEPLFNDKKWITGIVANGLFIDRKFGHLHTQQFVIPLSNDDCIFAVGQSKEAVDEAFTRIAAEKLKNSDHLKQVRKTINTALGIQTAIVAGIGFGAILLGLWIW